MRWICVLFPAVKCTWNNWINTFQCGAVPSSLFWKVWTLFHLCYLLALVLFGFLKYYFPLEFSEAIIYLSVLLAVPQSRVPSGHFEIWFYQTLTFPVLLNREWRGWVFFLVIWGERKMGCCGWSWCWEGQVICAFAAGACENWKLGGKISSKERAVPWNACRECSGLTGSLGRCFWCWWVLY